jgi:hypothetical protein
MAYTSLVALLAAHPKKSFCGEQGTTTTVLLVMIKMHIACSSTRFLKCLPAKVKAL